MNQKTEAAIPNTVNHALENLLGAVAPERAARIEHAVLSCLCDETVDDWRAALKTNLDDPACGPERCALFERYRDAFPAAYRENFPARLAAEDVPAIERVIETGRVAIALYRPPQDAAHIVHLRLYEPWRPTALSAILPRLENMGVTVDEHLACQIHPANAAPVCFQDFAMTRPDGAPIDLHVVATPFCETFARVLRGEVEDDGFNRLVVGGALDWRAITVLRAYCRYARQLGSPFSESYIERALARNPSLARDLVALFEARFDPATARDRAARVTAIAARIRTRIDDVTSLDEERILNRYLDLVQATLRTNFYQLAPDGSAKPYLSFKIDSQAVAEMPEPRPRFEIFVYSPGTEGIHLRGGKVARGGLRWSDRPEDLRTEILGLLKAQRVKNVVIVPEGAKGGFVVKGHGPGTPASREEGIASYETFVRGLLDVTDNVTGGDVAPLVAETVCWDDADPYLVVAADKGTALFSDIANRIAHEYGFWLDDAFASGGSVGYDHKQMGITARGAWEAVKRHFRELDRDIGRDDFSVVAVGDMSGDVFGNGMLLSRRIRLLGAFDHRHIFLDPDPDPATSFAERRRLFQLGASTWKDYNPALISQGGGVFARSAKSIPLSGEVRNALGIEAERLRPDELIHTLLRAPVDLLWLGGIGTYVKATDETHADACDRGNDGVRIDARELHCRIIGEGANLGLTQRARIEYALGGGRINTDAIDNAAGVNCSDHEVNIKILLNAAVADGRLSRTQRDELLATMTDEVAELVLRDNHLQTQAISVTERHAVDQIDRHGRLMDMLERSGQLDRRLVSLPPTEELRQRRGAGVGLTRPEISVLLAHTKLSLYAALLASDLPDDPLLVEDLVRYFPTPLRFPYRDLIETHPLRREIIASAVVNSMVNRVGSGFVNDIMEKTGLGDADAAKAYAIARDTFELRRLWRGIEAINHAVAAGLQTDMLIEIGRLVEHATLWFVQYGRHPLDISATVERFAGGVAELLQVLPAVIPERGRSAIEERARDYRQAGVPDPLAARIAALPFLTPALDIVSLALEHGVPVERVARRYFELGERYGLDELRARARAVPTDDAWEREAVAALQEDLASHQRKLTSSVLESTGEDDAPLTRWSETRRHAEQRLHERIVQLCSDASVSLAKLIVVNRDIRALIETAG